MSIADPSDDRPHAPLNQSAESLDPFVRRVNRAVLVALGSCLVLALSQFLLARSWPTLPALAVIANIWLTVFLVSGLAAFCNAALSHLAWRRTTRGVRLASVLVFGTVLILTLAIYSIPCFMDAVERSRPR